MAVTPQEAAATLRARWAREQQAIDRAADEARAILPALAAELRRLGAQRVWLFGSLAEGRFRLDSDIDLAVEDLPSDAYLGVMSRLADKAGRWVDVVRLEEAPASLVARVGELGVPL